MIMDSQGAFFLDLPPPSPSGPGVDTSLKGSLGLTPYCSDPQLVLLALGTLNSDPASCSRGRWPEGSFRTCPQLHTRPSLSAHPPASSCPQRAFLAPLPAQQDVAFRESSATWRDTQASLTPHSGTSALSWLSFKGTYFHKKHTLYVISGGEPGRSGVWDAVT